MVNAHGGGGGGGHDVLIRNAPADACDAIYTSENYEEILSSLLSDDSTRVFVHLKNKQLYLICN